MEIEEFTYDLIRERSFAGSKLNSKSTRSRIETRGRYGVAEARSCTCIPTYRFFARGSIFVPLGTLASQMVPTPSLFLALVDDKVDIHTRVINPSSNRLRTRGTDKYYRNGANGGGDSDQSFPFRTLCEVSSRL